MSTESLKRTSNPIENPSQHSESNNVVELDVLNHKSDVLRATNKVKEVSKRVNIEILKQRLYEEKKKEKVKRTIILSSVIVSLGALTMLTY
tara:strand:+ start:272 stop:544 length:273 start_codon:yes stop_codon:yes gene_type:complete